MTEFPIHWATTKPILKELGVDVNVFSLHESKPITEKIADKSYVIFAMDMKVFQNHEASLIKQFPQYGGKIRIFTELVGRKYNIIDCGPHPTDAKLHRVVNEKIVWIIRREFLSWIKKKEAIMDIKHILKFHAYQNIPLNYEEAYELGAYALEGCKGNKLAQKQSIAALCALHTKATYAWKGTGRFEQFHKHRLPKNAAEQIAGVCAAIFEKDIALSRSGFLSPNIPYAMDNCGMGGDIIDTANVSTVAALIASAAGIFMCKHGSPGNTRRIGSSEFVSVHCDINVKSTKKKAEKCLENTCFCYTEALDTKYKRIHSQTHKIAMLPHMNDIIGPITNPLDSQILTRRALGVNHLISPSVVAEAYKIMNKKGVTNLKHGLFFHGFANKDQRAGMDEISICPGGTQVAELKNGKIREYYLYAKDFGLKAVPLEAIVPQGDKGEFSLKILKGEISGPPLQMVLANAAILFYLAEKSQDLKECYKMAEEIHRSGKAYKTMLAVQKMLPK